MLVVYHVLSQVIPLRMSDVGSISRAKSCATFTIDFTRQRVGVAHSIDR
jgi:hypothetical protein